MTNPHERQMIPCPNREIRENSTHCYHIMTCGDECDKQGNISESDSAYITRLQDENERLKAALDTVGDGMFVSHMSGYYEAMDEMKAEVARLNQSLAKVKHEQDALAYKLEQAQRALGMEVKDEQR